MAPSDPVEGQGELWPPPPAGVLARFVAWVIDSLVVAGPLGILLAVGFDTDIDPTTDALPQWWFTAAILAVVIYEFVLLGTRGTTIGKVTLGLRVADLATGSQPSWTQAAMRVLVRALFSALFGGLFAPVVYIPVFVTRHRQGLHDQAAATIVVRTR